LLLAHPDAAVRRRIISYWQGEHWLQLVPPGAGGPVRVSLGIPDTLLLLLLTVYNPLEWDGYDFALRGTLAQETPHADTAPIVCIRVETETGTWKDFPVVAWERLVLCPDTDVYIQARWNPNEGERVDLRGFEGDLRESSLKQAHRGMRLLKTITVVGGRPPGSRQWSEAEFRQAYHETYQTLLDAYESPPTRKEVAQALHIDETTFRTYRRTWHLPFPPF
jgi:hypothetical protein